MIRLFFVFGTRPEAIKLCPVIAKFRQFPEQFDVRVCVTAQHRELLDQVLEIFALQPDYDLNVMQPAQTLFYTTETILHALNPILSQEQPDWVFVQGDTTTVFAAALAAFYHRIPVAHVEAGLRTDNIYNPFPEEVNRRLVSVVASLHFAPTEFTRQNLLREGIANEKIFVTGNTVIDALLAIQHRLHTSPDLLRPADHSELRQVDFSKRIVLVTGHRRENFGIGFQNICEALGRIAKSFPDVELVYPVHLNPNVQRPVFDLLGSIPNIKLIAPLDYLAFVYLLERCYLALTDSGGIQEEAPALGKPVLVMRETTERQEAIAAGTARLVGTDVERIVSECTRLLNEREAYLTMARAINPYGDGTACEQIVRRLSQSVCA